jgi:hypothetical protein
MGGPVQFRWQFCIEREFKHIRTKCGNKNKIEACIAKAYILEEVSDATTTYYAEDIPTLHNKLSRYNVDEPVYKPELLLFQGQGGKAGACKSYTLNKEDWENIMFYVLTNIPEVQEPFMR